MPPLPTAQDYLKQLMALKSGEAKRLWKRDIKERDQNRCVYCGSAENITLDHVTPKARGGIDVASNLVACCLECNGRKSDADWMSWYLSQPFFDVTNFTKILQLQSI